ncbi:hypothetical protein [Azospirillum palustre]
MPALFNPHSCGIDGAEAYGDVTRASRRLDRRKSPPTDKFTRMRTSCNKYREGLKGGDGSAHRAWPPGQACPKKRLE